MIQLKKEIRKNGFTYKQVQREAEKAIYAQYDDGYLVAYEVFRIRIQRTRYSQLLKREIPESERYPCNEDFGKTAFTCKDLKLAISNYNNL